MNIRLFREEGYWSYLKKAVKGAVKGLWNETSARRVNGVTEQIAQPRRREVYVQQASDAVLVAAIEAGAGRIAPPLR